MIRHRNRSKWLVFLISASLGSLITRHVQEQLAAQDKRVVKTSTDWVQERESTETIEATPVHFINNKEVQLTFDGRLKSDPVLIDGGKSIVYTSLEKFNQLCLMKLRLNAVQKQNSKPERFHPSATTSELMVSFAKKEKQYVYLRNNGNLHFEIVLENLETGETVKHNPGGGFAGVRSVAYHPSGSQIIFAFPDQNGPQQIWSMSSKGGKVAMMTNSEGINRCPKYSADGKRVVFSSSRDGNFDIFVMASDGSKPVNLTGAPGMDTHPVFSPDGKQIAFTGLRNGNYDIYIIRADGSGLRRLTNSEEVDDYPAWSADGNAIIWVGERNGKRDLYQKSIR